MIPSTKQTILITGGAGYVGSYVNRHLRRAGYSTLILDNLSRGPLDYFPDAPFIQGDMGDSELLKKIFSEHPIGAVFHFAALTSIGDSMINPAAYYLNNIAKTIVLLNEMITHQIGYFVFSSSAGVYGHPQSELIDENHPCRPINPYGETKLAIEKALGLFDKAHGLKSCSLRYFNAAGGDPQGELKYRQPRPSNLIPILIEGIKKGKPAITINGSDYPTPDGTCIRDYVHLEDLAKAHLSGFKRLNETRQSSAYNLGIGRGFSVKEVVQAAENIAGQKIEVVMKERRPGDPSKLVADGAKARRELNWKPHCLSIEKMILDALNAS